MRVKFFTKENPSRPISEVVRLGEFLLDNKQYIEITLKIISQVKTSINNIETMERLVDNRLLKLNKSYDKEIKQQYIQSMSKIYQHSNRRLDKHRGDILEMICSNMVICRDCKKESQWRIIPEAKVFVGKKELSPKDIDLVFQHCEIDMLECKCNIHNYLKVPVDQDTKDKLSFMDTAREISNKGIKTTVYFVTAQTNDEPAKGILKSLGYTHFEIFKAQDILDYV